MLVDKAAFPRDKVCGDGLTPRGVRAIQRMGIDSEDPGFERTIGLRIRSRKVLLELPWPDLEDYPGFGLVRTRLDFDELLARRAQSAGATLLERTEAVSPILTDGWVTGAVLRDADGGKETATRRVRARYVIASDGASSRFA